MTDVLPTNLGPDKKDSPEATAEPQTPGRMADGNEKLNEAGKGLATSRDGEVMSFASLEPSTLQWPAEKDALKDTEMTASQESERESGEGKETDGERASVRSECLSLREGESTTESERELRMREKRKTADGWPELEKEKEKEREVELELRARQKGPHLEIEMDEVNSMPEEAAMVFRPNVHHSSIVPESPREWNDEKSPFMGSHGAPMNGYYHDWEPEESPKLECAGCSRDLLKVGTSMFSGAIIFPFLVWGGYVFLPFDAPLLETAPLRLVYTLRCSVFAVVPIVLGLLVLGISRWRFGALRPLYDSQTEMKEVMVHRLFVNESVSLFVLYFVQLGILAAYLSHDLLKLVPLLTIIFAFGRLCYWVAAAWGSSVRGFGFALSFLPMVTMLVANMYFIFALDADGGLFAQEARASSQDSPPPYRQRFWG